MKIAVVGTGYVGLVTGTCFAEFGFEVTCVDKDTRKISMLQSGKAPIYEPGLEILITQNVNKNRLKFSTSLGESIKGASIVFIAVGTPPDPHSGRADLSFAYAAAEEIAQHLEDYTVIASKSTVPVGTARQLADRIRQVNPQADFDVVANPEFLREGSAIEDFMRPNRIIIGCESPRAKDLMHALYRPIYLLETPAVYTTLETAELIKYASNAFLATKIAFINEIADLCEKCGADVYDVSIGMGLDQRVGKKFLHAGPGYGGSCFPKDTMALTHTARDFQSPLSIVESVIHSNKKRKQQMAYKIISACGGDLHNKKLAILGLTFKPNTDDTRESASLDIIPILQQSGAHIVVFDPQGMESAKKTLDNIEWASNAYEAMQGADALVIITEWNEFRALDLKRVKALLRTPLIIDLRNIYTFQEVSQYGIAYHCVGRSSGNLLLPSQNQQKIA